MLRNASGRVRPGWRLGFFVALLLAIVLGLARAAARFRLEDVHSLGIPWRDELLLLVSVWLASAIMMRWVERKPLAALGLPWRVDSVRRLTRGAVLGVGLTGTMVVGFVLAGWLRWVPRPSSVAEFSRALVSLGTFLAVGALAEEVLVRGYVLQVLAEGLGGPGAIAVTSVVFGILHLGNPGIGWLSILNLTLAGALLGTALWRTYSLWLATGIHFGWNWFMGFVSDLPVSGLHLGTPVYDARLSGPHVWTGGAFGPEGGLAATLVLGLGLAWLARWPGLRRDPHVFALGPLPERRHTSHTRRCGGLEGAPGQGQGHG